MEILASTYFMVKDNQNPGKVGGPEEEEQCLVCKKCGHCAEWCHQAGKRKPSPPTLASTEAAKADIKKKKKKKNGRRR